ncbi:hypothetical protein ROMU108268_17700 [Roseomonas mucosa]
MKTRVRPSRSRSSAKRFTTPACTETSRAETGSSATIISGSTARARAMPMRCRWPPENSCGRREAASGGRFTEARSSATRPAICGTGTMPWTRSASPSVSPTVRRGFREVCGSWNTICARRWKRRRVAPRRAARSSPPKLTCPPSGESSPTSRRARVDLPQPDSPTMPSTSPRRTASDTPRSACTRPPRGALKLRVASLTRSSTSGGVNWRTALIVPAPSIAAAGDRRRGRRPDGPAPPIPAPARRPRSPPSARCSGGRRRSPAASAAARVACRARG